MTVRRQPRARLAAACALACLLAVPLLSACGGSTDGSTNGRPSEASSGEAAAPMDVWLTTVIQCLHDRGWVDVKQADDAWGIDASTVPQAQLGSFDSDRTACEEKAGPAPNDVPLDEARINRIYDHWVAMRSCLADLGYTTSEPPSREVFIDDYLHNPDGPWSPYIDLDATDHTQAEWNQITTTCPQDPDYPAQ